GSTLEKVLDQFWNPSSVDAVSRLLTDWDAHKVPANVSVVEDYQTPCQPDYTAYGHVMVDNVRVADAFRYVQPIENLTVTMAALRLVREVTPTLRMIFGAFPGSFSTFGGEGTT